MAKFEVLFAVYGALLDDKQTDARAISVREPLAELLSKGTTTIKIDNITLKSDPCPNYTKYFAAMILRDGAACYFACKEDQTIDFTKGG